MSPLPLKKKSWIIVMCALGVALMAFACWLVETWSQPSYDSLRRQCQRAAQLRKWDQLLDISTKWSSRDSLSGEANVYQAEAFRGRGEFEQASARLAKVPRTAPEFASAMQALMDLQFGSLNRPRDGALTAEKILQEHPDAKVAQQRLIFFLTMTLQRSRLNQQIRSAFDADAEPREAYVYLFFLDSLFFANGAELNGKWLSGEPDSELFEVGEAVFIAETLDASVSMDDREASQAAQRDASRKAAVLETLRQKYPHNAELLAYQIRQCTLTANVTDAVKLLAQAPAEAERDNRFWRYKGWVHAQSNEPQEAEAAYRQALKLHPLDWSTRHLMAELLQRQQRLNEVGQLRKLVSRANEIRRVIQRAPSARQIPAGVMSQLADYAGDCGDSQTASILRRRIQQHSSNSPNSNSN
jgi:hypothetical protein